MKVGIRVPSRLHFALCDLRPASIYSRGGIGLGISEPYLEITCSAGQGLISLEGHASDWESEISRLVKSLHNLVDVDNLDLEIRSQIPPHSGFGSHTALALGIVEAIGLTSRSNWNENRIIELSGRGGTSGVGIQTYFRGGLAYDFGRPEETRQFSPSSASQENQKPIFGPSVDFPAQWQIMLALPHGRSVFGTEEVEFFRTHTPLSELDALHAIASVHHGLIPSIASSDHVSLATSLRRVHLSGFKKFELENQTEAVRSMYGALVRRDMACGMSSFGPLLYSIVHAHDRDAKDNFETVAADHSAEVYAITEASDGRKVIVHE